MVILASYGSLFTHAKDSVDVAEVTVIESSVSTDIASIDVASTEITKAALLQALMLEKGAGSFVQRKHFKFLAVPIRSTGDFIVEQQSVLWQTQSPVFSAILIQQSGIYRRLSLEDKYEQLVDNAEFSSLLATVFTGKINSDQWQVSDVVGLVDNNYCLALKPSAKQLQQLFQQVDLCLPSLPRVSIEKVSIEKDSVEMVSVVTESIESEKQHRFDLSKRHINIVDMQGNKTQISMQINSRTLTAEQIKSIALTQESAHVITNVKAQVNAH